MHRRPFLRQVPRPSEGLWSSQGVRARLAPAQKAPGPIPPEKAARKSCRRESSRIGVVLPFVGSVVEVIAPLLVPNFTRQCERGLLLCINSVILLSCSWHLLSHSCRDVSPFVAALLRSSAAAPSMQIRFRSFKFLLGAERARKDGLTQILPQVRSGGSSSCCAASVASVTFCSPANQQ